MAKDTITTRRECAGFYTFYRTRDGAMIGDAQQGALDHDPKAWMITYYSYEDGVGWSLDDNDVSYLLREAKDWMRAWAQTLDETKDRGLR